MSYQAPAWLELLIEQHGQPTKEDHRRNTDSWWWKDSDPHAYVLVRHNQWQAETIAQCNGRYVAMQTLNPLSFEEMLVVLKLVGLL